MSEPKLFISYSWSSPDHQKWVLRLATELRENGVDVILDKWDLKEGHDANAFMEKMVSDESIKKVIMVLDEQYSEKANKRSGGVGTETQIISAEVYESVNQNKFVAVVASRDQEGQAKLPIFYKSRIYIDLSDEALYGSNFEQLLRWIYDKPLNIKPELGKKPSFLNEETSVSLGTSVIFRRLIDAVKNARPHASGALVEYFSLFARNVNRFRLDPSQGHAEFDQKVVDNIAEFLPARNELIEVFATIAQYDPSLSAGSVMHKFFESLISCLDKPESVVSYHKWDWDNLKFIIHESFLIGVGVLLKYERYDLVECLLRPRYFVGSDQYGQGKMQSYGIFRSHLESLAHRNSRLKLRRLSLHADLLKERCTDSGLSFSNLMQADFLLYLVEALQGLSEHRRQEWWPETLVFKTFHGGTFEMFLRAESLNYFNRFANLLGIRSKAELSEFIEGLKSQAVYVPKWDFDSVNPLELMNYERLCIRP
ncbi:SEFIR domain protein [compost metagenome]